MSGAKAPLFFCYNDNVLTTENQSIEITPDQIQSWCPMISLPCYNRELTEPFMMSLIQSTMYFKQIGLRFAISTVSDSLISRARCNLVAKFMANEQFTHLLFIDVDLKFNYNDILKLLWHDKDVITGAYPIKDISWDKVHKMVQDGVPADKLAQKATRFVVNPVNVGQNKIETDNGAISVYDAGTGFMLIKREVFTKMFEHYPELKFNDDTGSLKDKEKDYTYALFNSYVDNDQKRFLSEDYGFCRYWQKMGGKVWVDPAVELEHLGHFVYKGNMIDYLIDISQKHSENENAIKSV